MTDREAFEATLLADRYDRVTRLVFADWLEERGLDDEASEQRRMAGEEWIEAAKWMEKLAERAGGTCTNWSEAFRTGVDEKWHKITFDDLIETGREFVKTGDCFVQQGEEDLRDMMHEGDTLTLYWKHWQTITGEKTDETELSSPFSCSC